MTTQTAAAVSVDAIDAALGTATRTLGEDEQRLPVAWTPYLTMSEGLRRAAQALTRDVSRVSCCAD